MPRSSDIDPIQFVSREVRRAWDQVAPVARRRVVLNARTALGLVFACQAWAQYALLLDARKRWPKDRTIQAALEHARVTVRGAAADFHLIRPGRQQLAVLSPAGEDAELLRVFGRPGRC